MLGPNLPPSQTSPPPVRPPSAARRHPWPSRMRFSARQAEAYQIPPRPPRQISCEGRRIAKCGLRSAGGFNFGGLLNSLCYRMSVICRLCLAHKTNGLVWLYLIIPNALVGLYVTNKCQNHNQVVQLPVLDYRITAALPRYLACRHRAGCCARHHKS
jgi:hypothetical protein